MLLRQVSCKLTRLHDGSLRCSSLSALPLELDGAAAQRLTPSSVVFKVLSTGGEASGARPVWLRVVRHGVGGQFQALGALFGPVMGTEAVCAASAVRLGK